MEKIGDNARTALKSFAERVERLEEEKKAIGDDIRDVYAEAKANGFDVKALRTCVRERKMDAGERVEQEAITDMYRHVLGLIKDRDPPAAPPPPRTEQPPQGAAPKADTSKPPFQTPDEMPEIPPFMRRTA